jgi:transcriptional regulator with XRE-family HTH domain
MSELLDGLRETFSDEDVRYGYVEGALNAFVAAQIKELREEREMSQQVLAEAIGTKQSGISRLENANYASWKIETLRKLARAFGVRLRIGFEEFGTLLPEIENLSMRLRPRKFEDDPVFQSGLSGSPETKGTWPTFIHRGVVSEMEHGSPPAVPSTWADLPQRYPASRAHEVKRDQTIPQGELRDGTHQQRR